MQPRQRAIAVNLVLGLISGLAMALAAYALIAPLKGAPPLFPYQDKVFHLACFAALTGPAVLVIPRPYLWFWVTHMAVLGIGIEIVQEVWLEEEGRSGSWTDLIADFLGIFLALAVGRAIRSRFEAHSGGRLKSN